MGEQLGTRSLCYAQAPFILSAASVVGTRESQGPLGAMFDMVTDDDKFGQDNWEEAESSLQKDALTLALGKAGCKPEDVRFLLAGDLLGQDIASSFGLMSFEIGLLGLYGACSTCGEGLSIASMLVAAEYASRVAVVTSSHFASAEKQFRFPLQYANQRPCSATWTVTGGGAFILGNGAAVALRQKETGEKNCALAKIAGVTVGKIVDYGIKDSMNMGAAMAPAACDTIVTHFKDFGREPKDYDRIVTGDLGTVGQEILFDLVEQQGYELKGVHEDCGIKIFDNEKQGTGAGGSGCGCSAVTLAAYYLPLIKSGALKRVLFVPTGALLSPISFNEGQNVPGIAHAVVIEHVEE